LGHFKQGGFLPAILAAVPTIAVLASSAYNTYQNKKANDRLLEEQIRHNKAPEGKGLYLNKKPKALGEGVRCKTKGKWRKKPKTLGEGLYLNKKPKALGERERRKTEGKQRKKPKTSGKGLYLNKKPKALGEGVCRKKPKAAGKGLYLNKKPKVLGGNALLREFLLKKKTLR